jgi:hypothetical protein
MDKEILDAIMTELAVPVWPVAGKALGFRTRSAAFAAARRGAIRTIDGMGRKKPVPTAWLRQVLCLENSTTRPRRRKAAVTIGRRGLS